MANVYQVGVQLMLNNGVSAGLAQIIRQLGQANVAASTFNATLARTRLAAAGVASILGGVVILEGLKKLADHGKSVNDQLERMKLAGMSYKEIQDGIVQAQRTSSNVMTTTYSENLKHLLELRYAFGESSQAMGHLDEIAKANAVLNAMKGGGKDQVWEFVKSLEGKGLTYDPAAFSSYINTMTKVIEATGGRVTPEQFYGTFKYGRTATQLWDEGFIGGALPRLIQEMSSGGGSGGAGGPGNALMTGFGKIVAGTAWSKLAGRELEFLGMGTAEKVKGTNATIAHIPKESQDLFAKNPYEWTQQILGPALAAKGITDQVEVAKHVQTLFGVRTVADAVTKMLLQGRFMEGAHSPFEKDIALQKGAMPLDKAYDEISKKHYATVLAEFNAQWKRLLETLGSPAMEGMIPIVKGMADAMKSIGEFAAAHPEGVKKTIEVLAGLGGGLIVGGLVALGVAIAGLLGPVGLATAALATLIALDSTTTSFAEWLKSDSISQAVTGFFSNIGNAVITGCQNAVNTAIAAIPGIFASIGSAIMNALKSAISGIGGAMKGAAEPAPDGGKGSMENGYKFSPMNYRDAPPKGGGMQQAANVYLDGRKVGDIVLANAVRSANSPTQGSVYPDGTRTDWRTDTTYLHA